MPLTERYFILATPAMDFLIWLAHECTRLFSHLGFVPFTCIVRCTTWICCSFLAKRSLCQQTATILSRRATTIVRPRGGLWEFQYLSLYNYNLDNFFLKTNSGFKWAVIFLLCTLNSVHFQIKIKVKIAWNLFLLEFHVLKSHIILNVFSNVNMMIKARHSRWKPKFVTQW